MTDQLLDALLSPGPAALGVVLFALFASWCYADRRVARTLAGLGLYLGLLDGYLKLRTGSPVVTLGRDVLIVAIALGVLMRSMPSWDGLRLPPLGGFVVAFCSIVVVGLANPSSAGLEAGLAGVRQHLEFVPLFFLGFAVMRSERRLRAFALILVICGSMGGVVAYVQSTLTPDQMAQWGPGYRERVYGTGKFVGAGRVAFDDDGTIAVRPFGLGSDMGGGSLAAALALPSLLALLLWARGRLRLAVLPAAIGLGLGVATSGSRAGLLIVSVSVLAFGLLALSARNAARVIIGLAVSGMLVYAAFQQLGPDNSTAKRAKTIAPTRVLTTYQRERGSSAAKVAEYAARWPLGLGVGSSGPAGLIFGPREQYERLSTETLWNFLALEVGIPGLAIFLAMLLATLVIALTRIRRVTDLQMRFLLAAVASPLFGLLAASFAGPTTIGVPAGPYLWFSLGVVSYWLMARRVDLPARRERDAPATRPRVDARVARRAGAARDVARI